MNAPFPMPPAGPTLLQLALDARRTELTANMMLAAGKVDVLEWREAEAAERTAAAAFFAALEVETGIDRDLVRLLGGMA